MLKGCRDHQREVLVVAFLLSAGGLLFALAAANRASADVTFCTPGSAAGQCENPQGVAADTDAGNAYVADTKNNRIDVFDAAGAFQFAFGWGVDTGAAALEKCTEASGCQKGLAGSGAGELERPVRIAIDNTAERLYVIDSGNNRVQKFDLSGNFLAQFASVGECTINAGDPLSVGPTGFFYVADGQGVSKFSEEGACQGKVALVESGLAVRELAVNSSGDLFTSIAGEGGRLRKFSAGGTLLCSPAEATRETSALGVDAAGDVFAGQSESGINRLINLRIITEYDNSCMPLQRFGYETLQSNISGVSPYHSPTGDVFAVEDEPAGAGPAAHYLKSPPPGPIVVPGGVDAINVGNTRATLRAELNPEGAVTEYRFEYLTEAEFEAQGSSFVGPATKSTATQTLGATDFALHSVQALAGCSDPSTEVDECLIPETTYRFRVVATNAGGGGEGTVEGPSFKTKQAIEPLADFSTEVGVDTATLNAEANPEGISASGYFEYVDDASYQQSGFANAAKAPDVEAGAGEIDFGSGEAPAVRSVSIVSLAPGTTYHYRASFTDSKIAPNRIFGPENTLRTFAAPAIQPCPVNEAFRTGFSAFLNDCRAYELVSPLDKEGGDVIPLGEATTSAPAVLDQSSVSGSKVAYGSYRAFGDAVSAPFTSQYIAERGGEGWQSHTVTGPRARLNALVLDTLDTELKLLSPDLCDGWLQAVAEPPLAPDALVGYRNLYRRHDGGGCGTLSYEAITTQTPLHKEPGKGIGLELQGVSADQTISIYTANDNLEGTLAPDNPTGKRQLYRHGPSGTEFVCILPGGAASTQACSAGTNYTDSGGQNRTANLTNALSSDGQRVFWTNANGPGEIYVRVDGTETLPVSEEGEIDSGTSASMFLAATDNGSKALYQTGKDLYEFEVDTETTTHVVGGVAGILGASEDLSRVYVVSEEVLDGANGEGRSPIDGKPNLYLDKEGSFTFIATLTADDVRQGALSKGETSPLAHSPFQRSSRLTPDGEQAIFTIYASPKGYENVDVGSGETDAELYRYDALTEELECVSCNPTNARPIGTDVGQRISGGASQWAAGWIAGWENSLYGSRALSEDGSRVFFESSDALSPHDTNGIADVYQWEEPGTGSCTSSSASFSPANGGCVDLISSGESNRASEFDDASPSGDDVFFSTLASLVPQDYGLVDIYDARVGGGLPSPPLPAAECEGEACQHPAPAPGVQSPSSLGTQGNGNVQEQPKKCPKGKVRRRGRCVKKHHKKRHHHRNTHKNGRAGR
jgi:DNA-binding beta-propeller fold protein YncE